MKIARYFMPLHVTAPAHHVPFHFSARWPWQRRALSTGGVQRSLFLIFATAICRGLGRVALYKGFECALPPVEREFSAVLQDWVTWGRPLFLLEAPNGCFSLKNWRINCNKEAQRREMALCIICLCCRTKAQALMFKWLLLELQIIKREIS